MPRIPECVQLFMKLAKEQGIKTLQEAEGKKVDGRDVVAEINKHSDRNDIENIIDNVNKYCRGWSYPDFLKFLEDRFNKYYPDQEPPILGDIKQSLQQAVDLPSWEELLAEKTLTASDRVFIENVRRAYEEAVEACGTDLIQIRRVFGDQLKQMFPRQDRSFAAPVDEIMKRTWNFAVAALARSEFTRFDPVIGDEACEARPPFIIDAWEVLEKSFNLPMVRRLADAYVARHEKRYTTYDLKGPGTEESAWTQKFVDVAARFRKELVAHWPGADEYLALCYANTAASYMAVDEIQMASFDRERNPFGGTPDEIRNKRVKIQSELSICSVAYLKKLAEDLACGSNKMLAEIAAFLRNLNFARKDKGLPIYCLPIYETMRTVLAHEARKKRSIILSLYQIDCNPQAADREIAKGKIIPGGAEYTARVKTLFFTPDGNGVYRVAEAPKEEDGDRPCLAIQAYQLRNMKTKMMAAGDGVTGFDAAGEEYFKLIERCDLALLVQAYAAAHPVLPRAVPDQGEELFQKLYPTVGETPESVTRLSELQLLTREQDRALEHAVMKQLAESCDMGGKQYIERLIGDNWAHLGLDAESYCIRSATPCSFSVHHMNVNTWNTVRARDAQANSVTEKISLPRFHAFNDGSSFEDIERTPGMIEREKKERERREAAQKKKREEEERKRQQEERKRAKEQEQQEKWRKRREEREKEEKGEKKKEKGQSDG